MSRDDFTQHISRQFNEDLEEMRSHFLTMGGSVEQQVIDAVQSFVESDTELATRVIDIEEKINGLELAIDEECIRIIALRQPAASDLRLIVAATKANVDLERIGDEASKIAKMSLKLIGETASSEYLCNGEDQGVSADKFLQLAGFNAVQKIGNHVCSMLHQALDAFARFDTDLALKVVREDERVDEEYGDAMEQLVIAMTENPLYVSRLLNVMWSLRSLERIGDHASNLAEQVIYFVKGLDIRHIPLPDLPSA